MSEWPEIVQTSHYATFATGREQWDWIASHFDSTGEKRLAETIRKGVERQRRRNYSSGWIPLRFRDGSIAKISVVAAKYWETA